MADELFEDFGDGTHGSVFQGSMGLASNASFNESKPLCCSVVMSRDQLQVILNNPQLFDFSVINAAHLIANHYDTIEVVYKWLNP